MARKNTRAAQGAGTIRKKTVVRNGKNYEFWEARVTVGHDPGTGKQIQKSFTGKTQKEVREKMQAAAVALNNGTYFEPSRLTVSEWFEIWLKDYIQDGGKVKSSTMAAYRKIAENHILPALGSIRLSALSTPDIQRFYNSLQKSKNGKQPLSAKTIKNVHGVLHAALKKAVVLRYIPFNPADACELPRAKRKEIQPLDEKEISAFLKVIQGTRFELLYRVALFTGM